MMTVKMQLYLAQQAPMIMANHLNILWLTP